MPTKRLSLRVVLLLTLSQCAATGAAQTDEAGWADAIRAALSRNDAKSAVRDAQRAVEEYPRSAPLYQLLGGALFTSGANEAARSAFEKAIDLAPQEPLNYFNLARVDLSLNRYSDMVKSLTAFLRFEPRDAEAHVLLGRAYHNLNQTLLGIEQFKEALAIDEHLPLAHFHLGYAELSLGNKDTALAEFRRELEISPGFYDPYWIVGDIELERGDLKAAEDSYREGIAVKPRAFQAHYGLGRVLTQTPRFAEAEKEFQMALEYSPQSIQIHYALGRLYRQMGKSQEAQREFKIVSDLHSQDEAGSKP